MVLFFFLSFFLILGYLLLIGWVSNRWDEIPETTIPKDYNPKNSYSIIIPFRNEGRHLVECIHSLQNLCPESPKFELIAVNDGDHPAISLDLELDYPLLCVIESEGSGKKAAITTGITKARFDHIITIDADCTFHKDWLKLMDACIKENNLDVVVGSVITQEAKSLLSRFQFMDFAGTMAVNAAGVQSKKFFICSGANFCYNKSLFFLVDGYNGNEHIASGDDVFLINKFSDVPNLKIGFLKSRRGTSITKNETTWKDLIKQRVRWASKSKSYANNTIFLIQGYVFLLNLWLAMCFTILAYLCGTFMIITGLFSVFLKWVIDYLFLNRMVHFFRGKKIMKSFIPSSVIYTLYILMMAFVALFTPKTSWKGRKV